MTSSDSWRGETRRINSEFIEEYFNDLNNYHFMIAGPPKMVGSVEKELKKAGVEDENIDSENFSGY
jgi:ferredoxin-NADP reductase